MFKVVQGSIFDSKADLLVIPCDNEGGVTNLVAANLLANRYPVDVGSIPLGELTFIDVNDELTETLAYAAAVDVRKLGRTRPETITSLAERIVTYAKSHGLRVLNVPLLGSGAGGLSDIASFTALRSVFESAEDLDANVFCLDMDSYRTIANTLPKEVTNSVRSPRVFISYASNARSNAQWVRRLAEELRGQGVDARLDLFHLKPGDDLPQWMTNEVIKADKVILVCDQWYMEKANVHSGGVGWETMVIQGDMLSQGDTKGKYIAIARSDDKPMEQSLPIYMRSKYALSWGIDDNISEDKLKELVLILFDAETAPPLGKTPKYVLDALRVV